METFELTAHFSLPPEKLYKAWLDPVHHPAMSWGTEAEFDPRVGGAHSSGDGYITGVFEALDPGRSLTMTWRTTDFAEDQPDSRVVLEFEPADGGTLLRIVHSGLPADQVETYRQGWQEFYFEPMTRYFGG